MISNAMNLAATVTTPIDYRKWAKKAGKLGFWFFLIKGTLWMAAPLVFYFFT